MFLLTSAEWLPSHLRERKIRVRTQTPIIHTIFIPPSFSLLSLYIYYYIRPTKKKKKKKTVLINANFWPHVRRLRPYCASITSGSVLFRSWAFWVFQHPFSSLTIQLEAVIIEVSTVQALRLKLTNKCAQGEITWMGPMVTQDFTPSNTPGPHCLPQPSYAHN